MRVETAERAGVRERAEAVLRRLAGEHARLREDQWRAIEALVVDRRRVLCVQRTGWGKSAVYFVATALLRDGHAAAHGRADGHRVAAAGADAQPGRGGRPGRHPGPHHQLGQPRRVGRDHRRDPRRRGRRAADQPGAAQQPRLPRQRAARSWPPPPACWWSTRRTASPTGGTTSGPTTGGCARSWPSCPSARRCWPPPPPPTPGSPRTWPSSSGDALVLRGTARPRVAAARRARPAQPGAPAGLARRPPGPAARLGHHLHADRGGGRRDRRVPARPGLRRSPSYTGQAEDADRRAAEQDLLDNQIKALVATSRARHGLRQARPRLRRAPRRAALADRLLPAGRPGRPRRRARRGAAAARRRRTRRSGATSPRWRSRPRSRSAPVLAALHTDRPLSTQALEPLVDLRRARLELMLKVLDVDGAVRRVRGGWLATGEPWVYDEARLRRVAEARTAEQQAMREYATTPDCRMRVPAASAWTTPRRPTAAGATAAPARCSPPTCRRPALAAAQAFLGPPRRGDRAEEAVADRAGRGRRTAQGPDRPGGAGAAGPGRRAALRPGLGRPAARPGRPGRAGRRRCPTTWPARWSRC